MQPVFNALLPSGRKAASAALASWAGWTGLAARAKNARLHERLSYVNRAVNRAIVYQTDTRTHGKPDYWAAPSETLSLGRGDCEDFAIVKLWALAALGMPLDKLQLVVLKDRRRSLYHAVLVVHANGARYVLDNTTDRMSQDTAIADYQPLYSFASNASFVHGFEVQDSPRIQMADPFKAIHPGLGAPRRSP